MDYLEGRTTSPKCKYYIGWGECSHKSIFFISYPSYFLRSPVFLPSNTDIKIHNTIQIRYGLIACIFKGGIGAGSRLVLLGGQHFVQNFEGWQNANSF